MQLLDHPVISERYFFPRADALPDAHTVTVDGAELACYRTNAPVADAPWLLHFHGNGEVAADWICDFAQALEQRGLNVFLAEYRGYGSSTGRPAMASMLDDALVIADSVDCPLERLFLYGRSVGSIYALHVAAHRSVAGLIIESGIADVLERLELRVQPEELGATADELRAAIGKTLDHHAKVEAFAGPMLVLHAVGDDLVKPEHARTLAKWGGDRARLRLFEAGDHNTIFAYNGSAILDEVLAMTGLSR